MRGQKPTTRTALAGYPTATGFLGVLLALTASPAGAQIEVLEEITVTAQKREESLYEVPSSVATLSGENYEVLFTGAEDVLALSGRVPGLYAESSNGRAAPRFYPRGLGNIDFDLAASQPVLVVMDEVVMENVVLKSFPLFDMQQVEVIRGPQGTLFGRNTIAGIIKFNTARPTEELDGYVKADWGTYNTMNLEGAVGGALTDNLNARFSGLYRTRDNWITNGFTGQESLGEFEEMAARLQFDWAITDRLSALLSIQARDLEGTSSIFRANVFDTGSNSLNQNYDRDTVYFDGGDDNPQAYESEGVTLNIQYDGNGFDFTSITSFQAAEGSSRGDIDGGVVDFSNDLDNVPPGITFDPAAPVFGVPTLTYPGTILIPSVTEDGADTDQFTQEFRFASDNPGRFSWQFGAFYFDSSLEVTTENFASFGFVSRQDNKIRQENQTWAVFGQGSWDLTDKLNFTAGLRYTDDQRDFEVLQFAQLWIDLGLPIIDTPPISVSDAETSWETSLNYALNDRASVYGRVSYGFRAQTIQGRDVAFGEAPSVAEPETITSYEAGYKADLLGSRMRVNLGVFYYEVDDMQLSVIGGSGNVNQVINAAKGEAAGIEVDFDWLLTDNLRLSGGAAYNDTEINDPTLATVPCGSGLCTPLDPVDPTDPSRVLLDGNPFPRAPETTYNLNLRYTIPLASGNEVFFMTDWVWYGKINMPLYEAVEFQTDGQYEGGLRVGFNNVADGWTLALFGRNITDEDNTLGFIDFSNNTGFVNEPRVWGAEFRWNFGS